MSTALVLAIACIVQLGVIYLALWSVANLCGYRLTFVRRTDRDGSSR